MNDLLLFSFELFAHTFLQRYSKALSRIIASIRGTPSRYSRASFFGVYASGSPTYFSHISCLVCSPIGAGGLNVGFKGKGYCGKPSARRKSRNMAKAHRIHTQPIGFTFHGALELQAFASEPGLGAAGAATRPRTATLSTASTNTLEIAVLKLRPWIKFIRFSFWVFEVLSVVFDDSREAPRTRRGRGWD
jgi:hypothetical protein